MSLLIKTFYSFIICFFPDQMDQFKFSHLLLKFPRDLFYSKIFIFCSQMLPGIIFIIQKKISKCFFCVFTWIVCVSVFIIKANLLKILNFMKVLDVFYFSSVWFFSFKLNLAIITVAKNQNFISFLKIFFSLEINV
jgi:hypothetical protein